MKEKIVANKSIIMLIASIVAAALLVPTFIGYFGARVTANTLLELIEDGLLLFSALVLVFLLAYKKELTLNTLLIPVVLITSSLMLGSIYSIIEYDSWISIYYLAIYGSILILYIIAMINPIKYIKYALYVLLLIVIVMALLGVFGGNMISTARVIIFVIITINFYLLTNGKEKVEQ